MFDGVDLITLIADDARPLLDLYGGHLGFAVLDEGTVPEPGAWRRMWGIARTGPLRAWVLGKPGSQGGWLRIVEDRSAPPVSQQASIATAGPHALDFYVRDMPALHARLSADGASFRSPPQEYALFGAGFTVRECLLDAPLGLVHALVDYLPERHRCVLSEAPDMMVSETVAVVLIVPDVDAALAMLTDVLGASVYLDQTFHGPEIERLMALPPGTEFRMALTRGPRRRNARLEVIQQTAVAPGPPATATPGPPATATPGPPATATPGPPATATPGHARPLPDHPAVPATTTVTATPTGPFSASAQPPAPPGTPPGATPAMVLGCAVDDLDALHATLSGGRCGWTGDLVRLTGPGAPARSFGFAATWGATFEFFDRDTGPA